MATDIPNTALLEQIRGKCVVNRNTGCWVYALSQNSAGYAKEAGTFAQAVKPATVADFSGGSGMTTINTNDHHDFVARLQRVAGYRIVPGAPLVRYVNRVTGGELITRDVKTYDRIAEWERVPMNRGAT